MRTRLFTGSILLSIFVMVSAVQAQSITVFCDKPAGTIKTRLGGVALGGGADSYLKPPIVNAIKNLGIKMVRMDMVTCNPNYSLYDPATKKYTWDLLDREIETIQASGAEIILNIFGTPQWLSSDPEGKRGLSLYAKPRDNALWAEYVRQIVRHVNIDRKYNIKYWEIGNEPSGAYFFSNWTEGPQVFWELYGVTARAIKQADPHALVGGFADNIHYIEHYVNFFEFAKPRKFPIDFLTIHWYPEETADAWKKPSLYKEYPQALRELHFKYFKKHVPIFLTEWNLNAEAGDFSPAQQAAFIASGYYWLQEGPVDGANFFRVEDYKNLNRAMLDAHLQLRAPARVLNMFTMLPKTRLTVTGLTNRVVALAARNSEKIVVMVSRYDFDPARKYRPQVISIRNHGLKNQCRVTTYMEDSASAQKPGPLSAKTKTVSLPDPAKPITETLTLENYSAALIVIEK